MKVIFTTIFISFLLFAGIMASAQTVYEVKKGERTAIDLNAVAETSFEHDRILIKFKPEQAKQIENQHLVQAIDGEVKFGLPALDALNKNYKVKAAKQYFYSPALGNTFTEKHKAWGFHLWFELVLDKNRDDIKTIVSNYRNLSEIESADPIYKKRLVAPVSEQAYQAVQQDVKNTTDKSPNWTPIDPRYIDQWHYHNTGQQGGTIDKDIDLPEAWEIEKGNSSVIVAIVDGGIQINHPDLAGNIWSGIGYNFANNSATLIPIDHGTHVSGTVAAVSNNGIGVAGVAGGTGLGDGVRLMSCQVFSTNDINDGFHLAPIYAADNGASISQNSWGYTSVGVYDQAVLDAIDYFKTNGGGTALTGGITIFAAGNGNASGLWYPGCYSSCLSVAATNNKDEKAWYSNFDTWVDLSAPGGETNSVAAKGVLSTVTGGGYAYYQGTSMACPHTSGVAALMISLAYGQLTNTDVWNILVGTTENHYANNPTFLGKLGSGRLNAYQALVETQGLLTGIQNPSTFSATAVSATQINLQWAKNANNNEVMVVWSPSSTFGTPVDGTVYSAGQSIAGGGTVLYRGSATTFNHSGLTALTLYNYKAFSYTAANEYSGGRMATATTLCGSINTFPFVETFEDNSTSLSCWSQEYTQGNKQWTYAAGAGSGTITNAKVGAKNARFTSNSEGPYITKLISPIVDLTGQMNCKLSFWYGQEVWSSDQNQLKIYYRTAPTQPWVQIGSTYSNNIATWTQVTDVVLPNTSATYQIAFEGIDNWGYPNVIDQVTIATVPTGPFADFIANPTTAFTGGTILFTDASLNGPFTSYLWNFGTSAQPATATGQGPHAVTYSDAGDKTISLTLDGVYVNTKTNYVHIQTHPFQPPVNLTAQVSGQMVQLNWQAPAIRTFAPPTPKTFVSPFAKNKALNSQALATEIETIQGPTVVQITESQELKSNNKSLVFNSGPLINSPGTGPNGTDHSVLQNNTIGLSTLGLGCQFSAGNMIADDFTLANDSQIEAFTFYTYQTGSGTTSTITGCYMQILNGSPTEGGQVVWGDLQTNILSSTSWINAYRVSQTNVDTQRPLMQAVCQTPNLNLTAGSYWVVFTLDGSGASGPWAPPITITGQSTTGNAKQYQTSLGTWTDIEDNSMFTPQGIPFLIEGTEINADPIGYEVYRNNNLISSTNANVTTYQDGPLNNGSYTYFTKAIYDAGISPASNAVTVEINNLGCVPPTNISASAITTNSALISWIAGGSGTTWELAYGDEDFTPEVEGTLIQNINTLNYSLNNLQSGKNYDFYLRTNCGGSLSPWSTKQVFTTLTPLPEIYSFSGGGSYCELTFPSGINAILSSSQTDVLYTLFRNGNPYGTTTSGSGNPLIFNDLEAGTYSLTASNTTGTVAMNGEVEVQMNLTANVTLTITPDANPVCAGTTVHFTSVAVNGGSAPLYQWFVNGVNQQNSASSFSYIPTNEDLVDAVLTSNVSCAANNPATSNMVVMQVGAVVPASVSISASQNPICEGSSISFTAVPVNGGNAPAYQWKRNGLNFGANSPSIAFIPANGDQIKVEMTSSLACVTANPASSNTVSLVVNPISFAVAASPQTAGTVSFTGTPAIGQQLSIQAVANNGWQFVNWTDQLGNVVSTNATTNFTLTACSTLLTAHFSSGNTITGKLLYFNPIESEIPATTGSAFYVQLFDNDVAVGTPQMVQQGSSFVFNGLDVGKQYQLRLWEQTDNQLLGSSWTWTNWSGVTALDALIISYMSVQNDNLASFPWIVPAQGQGITAFALNTADVNASNTVTGLDALTILFRSVNYPGTSPFPGGKPNFIATAKKLAAAGALTYPQAPDIAFTSHGSYVSGSASNSVYQQAILPALSAGQNVVNVFLTAAGDVNASLLPGAQMKSSTVLNYNNIRKVEVQNSFESTIYLEETSTLGALNLNLGYDPHTVEIVEVKDYNVFYNNTQEGLLSIAWMDIEGKTFSATEPLLKVVMRLKSAVNEVYQPFTLADGTSWVDLNAHELTNMRLVTERFTTARGFNAETKERFLFSNFPNPFKNSTLLQFRTEEPSNIQLTINNSLGVMIHQENRFNQPAGTVQLEVTKQILTAKGMYNYILRIGDQTGEHFIYGKLILTE